MGILTIYRFK